MGKRFLAQRYQIPIYSDRRAFLRLNEGNFEPHRMKPYGIESKKFSYRQIFDKKHQSRPGNQAEKRGVKKAARRQSRFFINQEKENGNGYPITRSEYEDEENIFYQGLWEDCGRKLIEEREGALS
jgi:hypothetical protein